MAGGDLGEIVGGEMQREAAVAGAVVMAAFETGAGVAEQQGAGMQQRGAAVGAVAEAAGGDQRDRGTVVAFLEGAVGRAGRAQDGAQPPERKSKRRNSSH